MEGFFIVFIIIVARFPAIFLTFKNSTFSFKEKVFISWIGPRGIIAMAVASIIALKLKAHGFERSNEIEIVGNENQIYAAEKWKYTDTVHLMLC